MNQTFSIYQNQKWIAEIDAPTKKEALKEAKKLFPKCLNLSARLYNPILWDMEDRIVKLGLRKNWIAERLEMDSPTLTKSLSGYRPFSGTELKTIKNILGIN